ncbi:phosphoglycerate dehydrogenase [Candidatus Woesearchaeota archaeon]|nr:phosphoglycerate dehydrogenase [Candidatus Woesearchaeota archaeon]
MKILVPDKVSKTSLEMLKKAGLSAEQKAGIGIGECSSLAKGADALIVRSYDLHALEFHDSIKAIGRAGAGVNNIPVSKCTEKGIVVFNTPGANANAVKELVLCGLFLSSRRIVDGINWAVSQKEQGSQIMKAVEENKSRFKGVEIMGKKLGVIGLGAVGVIVSNAAVALGMDVAGYDPYISPENAEKLSRNVQKAGELDAVLRDSDYISIHVPMTGETTGFINIKALSKMKRGVRIMNFARDELVNSHDMAEAIKAGFVGSYVTDFPSAELVGLENVISVPHLGASTMEAEENCAVMAANQMTEFLTNGTISNSVNFPDCRLGRNGNARITVINKNIPAIIEKMTAVIAEANLNIEGMIDKSKGDIAYNILDINGEVNESVLVKISRIDGVIRVRKL